MDFRRIISKKLRHQGEGVQAAADVNAVIAGNIGKGGSSSHVSSRQTTRVVQRGGQTVVSDSTEETSEGGADDRREA